MLKLIIGNRTYSSWSLRGWLACRQTGLPFEEELIPLYEEAWNRRLKDPDLQASGGKVPVLIDGKVAAWNALGIIDHLERISGGGRFWPDDPARRAFLYSIAAEMQAGFLALRRHCPMNVRRHYPDFALTPEVEADVARIDHLWSQALHRFGGPWLGGADYGGADILYSAVASRFTTYDVRLSAPAEAYRERAMSHPWMVEWIAAAGDESWVMPGNER